MYACETIFSLIHVIITPNGLRVVRYLQENCMSKFTTDSQADRNGNFSLLRTDSLYFEIVIHGKKSVQLLSECSPAGSENFLILFLRISNSSLTPVFHFPRQMLSLAVFTVHTKLWAGTCLHKHDESYVPTCMGL